MNKLAILGHKGMCGSQLLPMLPKQTQIIEKGQDIDYFDIDILFCCINSTHTKKIVEECNNPNTTIIDLSSAYRADSSVPLILPTVNSHLINNSLTIISLPNCIVSIVLTALYPLHKISSIKKIYLTTFQAASGAGNVGLQALESNEAIPPFPYGLKDNLFLHESKRNENHFCDEEEKIIFETKKILENPHLNIHARCVRLPIKRAHSIHAVVTFEQKIHNIEKTLNDSDHITLHHCANPRIAENKTSIFISSIRKVPFEKNTYDFWIVGDQLLRGAALNAYEVFQYLCNSAYA